MKKISLRVRDFERERFLTYNIDNEASLDEDILDFIEDEEPQGIVPVIFEEGEEFDTFSYDITEKIPLSELSTQEINSEMALNIIHSLILALIDITEYRIPLSYLVLNRSYIYVDSDYKIEFVCIPLEDMQENLDINAFIRGFLANIRYDLSENCHYVARLLTYVNNTAMFNMRNMVTLVEELMDDLGVEIKVDDSAEIYVDYQEIDEEEEVADDDLEEVDAVMEADTEIESFDEKMDDASVAGVEEAAIADEVVEEADNTFAEEKVEPVEETEEDSVIKEETPDEIQEEQLDTISVQGLEEAVTTEEPEPAEEKVEEKTEETVQEEEKKLDDVKNVFSFEESEESFATPEKAEEEPAEGKVEEPVQPVEEKKDENIEKTEEKVEENVAKAEEKKESRRPTFKTKDVSVNRGVVIDDDFEEFVAEKEREEKKKAKQDEINGIKFKKSIKVNRASVVKSSHDDEKLEEVEPTEIEKEEETVVEEDEGSANTSILSQAFGMSGLLTGANVPRANPYLVRTNTEERVMITKQNFKIGKASMGVDYTIRGNGAISRSHAIIINKDGVYYIKDNKSTNHTYVNNKLVAEGQNELLTHDCKIVLGDEEFTFKLR